MPANPSLPALLTALAQPAAPTPAAPPPSGVCEAVGPLAGVCEAVGGAAGRIVGSTITGPADLVTALLLPLLTDTINALVDGLVTLILDTTTVDLGAAWFVERYELIVGVAVVVILPLALCGLIHALLRQDPAQVGRVAAAVPGAFVLTAAATTVLQGLVAFTDLLSAQVSDRFADDITSFFTGIQDLAAFGPGDAIGGAPPAALVVISVVLIALGALGVWLELLVRSVAIYAAVLLLPLAFVSLVWSVAARYALQLIRVLIMLIISKFVIVAMISLSAAALAETGSIGNLPTSMAGGMMLLLAMLAPWVLLRVAPGVDVGITSQGPRRWAARGAVVTAFAANKLIGAALAGRAGSGGAWPPPGNPNPLRWKRWRNPPPPRPRPPSP